jgi:hypothetical protein
MKTDKKILILEKENLSKVSVDNKPIIAKELNDAASKIEKDTQINKNKNVLKIYEVE